MTSGNRRHVGSLDKVLLDTRRLFGSYGLQDEPGTLLSHTCTQTLEDLNNSNNNLNEVSYTYSYPTLLPIPPGI